jgi:hypothetical protein
MGIVIVPSLQDCGPCYVTLAATLHGGKSRPVATSAAARRSRRGPPSMRRSHSAMAPPDGLGRPPLCCTRLVASAQGNHEFVPGSNQGDDSEASFIHA